MRTLGVLCSFNEHSWAGLAVSLALVSHSVLLGCGGASSESSSSTTPPPEPVAGPPRPWAEMSHGERARYMGVEVVPRMQVLFEGYSAERFAVVTCATCHGVDAAERHYAMPNPHLLALHDTGTPGQRETVDRFPQGVRFMFNHVTPTMQTLLGAASHDAATGEGFTCYACHPHAGSDEVALADTQSDSTAETALESNAEVGESDASTGASERGQ